MLEIEQVYRETLKEVIENEALCLVQSITIVNLLYILADESYGCFS